MDVRSVEREVSPTLRRIARSVATGSTPFDRRMARRDEQLGEAWPQFVDPAGLEPPGLDNAFKELARRRRQDPNSDDGVWRIACGHCLAVGVLVFYGG